MSETENYVDYVVSQMEGAGAIRHRHMFGGTTVYCDDKVVALVCGDQLFVKPTDAGRAFIGEPVEAPAYEGAKPSFLVEEQVEDAAWLAELIAITAKALPKPRPKKKKKA